MDKIQEFLKKQGIEDIIVTYDDNNEPIKPSDILKEWIKQQ